VKALQKLLTWLQKITNAKCPSVWVAAESTSVQPNFALFDPIKIGKT